MIVAIPRRRIADPGAACLFLLLAASSSPCRAFTPPASHRPSIAPVAPISMVGGASDLLYQEQEKLIVQRGEIEEGLVVNAKPLVAPKIKVRGAGGGGGFGKGGGGKKKSSKAEGKARAKVLRKEGVLLVEDVLSPETADAVREHLYGLRGVFERQVEAGEIAPIQRFADVLLKTNRCDLTVPLGDEIITRALEEALVRSPVGATIGAAFGDNAVLHEFSCLMSDKGSQRQVMHPDTPFIEGRGAVLYTCFVALQDVTPDMGPTVWLPGTHTSEIHEVFQDTTPKTEGGDSPKDALIRSRPAVLGTLKKGSCAIFDSRVLHCGTANRSAEGTSRGLFYFSFKNPEVGYTGNPPSIRSELGSAKVTLGDLTKDLESFGKGKGSPLIDQLAARMS